MESLAGAKANVTIISFLWLATLTPLSIQEQDDVQCLQGTKDALADPGGRLSSWNFTTVAATHASTICDFNAVTCWGTPDDSLRVLSLQLTNLELSGPIPESLQHCKRLVLLSLAGNNISGTIPPQNLRLLANCIYLNFLDLSDNTLSGTIPPELAKLVRLIRPSIAGSDPSGKIPPSFAEFNATSFSGNRGLCSAPLGRCGRGKRNMAIDVNLEFGMLKLVENNTCICT
ncbi:hypothetical protein EUGRSUZ_G02950 [Eucalyptus grandis]|uniref:Uncharacterized protein n=2 Tax=Eucalyptus grandis TaxID=71139 RepID=A0ACC3K954_EUCGR|nr:hypothetical protein EUGRSUZ_G02950 [Eucalyptus grandis]